MIGDVMIRTRSNRHSRSSQYGSIRSVIYGLISRLNLTFVVALCTLSGIRSHTVTPRWKIVCRYFSFCRLYFLNLILSLPRKWTTGRAVSMRFHHQVSIFNKWEECLFIYGARNATSNIFTKFTKLINSIIHFISL